MATNPRLEQLKTALINADKAGATEDARRLAEAIRQEQVAQQALQGDEFNRQQGFQLQPKTQQEIDQAQGRAVREAERAREQQREDNTVGGIEMGLREGAAVLESSRGFFEQLAATPSNLLELGSAAIEGREPQYAQPQVDAQQRAAAWLDTGSRERDLAAQIGGGVGGALAMIPEVLATGGQRAGIRAGEALWDAASQSWVRGTANTVTEAVPAMGILAPRLGAQTALEAEQAGATPGEALVAGAADTLGTIATAGLPLSATGRLGTRAATGVVGGIAAEAGTQAVVNPLLPDELAAQRDIFNPENATTAGVLGAGMAAAFGTRPGLTRAQRVEEQRLAELAAQDKTGKLAEGAALVAQAEAQAATREPFREMEQTAIQFPEREPTRVDMFSGEETVALAPETRNTGMTEDLVAAQASLDSVLTRDREIRSQIAEIESNPSGDGGKLSRSQRTRIKNLREQAGALGIQAEVARARVLEARTAPEAAIPGGMTPEQTRTVYSREMQSRQFDQVERERLGEMGGTGATETSTVFQPTKPRIRVEPEPVQESLALPKPRVRVGEDFSQQLPTNVDTRRTWQEGPTAEMDLRVPEAGPLESPVQGSLDLPATTPLPTTRAQRVEAPKQPTVDARVSPVEVSGPVVREDVIDPITGAVTGEQTAERGVEIGDADRKALEDFFTANKANRSVNLPPDQAAAFARIMNVQVPPAQRKATPLRQALARAKTAWDALAGVKAAVRMGADPKIERYDRLIDSLSTEDMKNVGFTLLQPETEPRTPFQQALKNDPKELQTKGLHEVDPATGRDEVTIVGDGYARRDGTATVETTLHEIVHAKGAAAIRAVKEGRETDAGVTQAVKDLDAVRSKLRQSIPKDGLTPDEKSAVEYATTNVDEFHANAMTNPLVQSALKKENLWDKVRSAIRALLRIPRSQKSLLDEVLDASYALTDAINKREGKAPDVRGDGEARRATTTTRSDRVADARSQFLGKGTKVEPTTDIGRKIQRFRDSVQERFFTNAVGRFIGDASRKIDVLFSANKLGTKETTEAFSKAQGAIQRAHAEMQAIGRAMDKQLGSVELQSGTGKSLLATQYLAERNAAKREEIAKNLKNPGLVKTLDKARAEMDRLSTEVGKHLVEAYAGRTMPKSVVDLLKTIKERMGSYLTRAYMVDIVNGDATETYNAYKRGDPAAVARLQPLVNRIGGTLAGLNSWVENARQEANVLSDPQVQFEASDTVFGREVRQRYSDFLGNPGSKTIKEMFDEIDAFAKKIPESEFAKEVDRTVQKLIGVFDDKTKNDALVQFARAMRSDDRTLRRRDRVPADLRLAWGEVINPILAFNLTAERTAAAYANLRSSNYLFDNAPNLFSEREDPQTKRLNRIPNNPTVYGKLAGMYTIPAIHDAVVAQTTMLAPGGAGNDITGMVGNAVAKVLREAQPVLSYSKLTQIAMNFTTSIAMSLPNLVYMPLANGNANVTTFPKALKAIQATLFTAYRSQNVNKELRELLDQGVIDPVQLQSDEQVRDRTRDARAFERGQVIQSTTRDAFRKGISNPVDSIRELVNFLELVPKAWNYFSAKEELRAIYPDLTEQQLRDMSAEQTNRLNPTYTRTRNIVRGAEVTQMSYTANYMEQIASNGARSINLGIVQTKNGLKTGNPRLAIAGLKKLLGSATALGLSYGLPATVLGILGISPEEEDETIADNLPFNERGMQPVILSVNGDRVTYTDAGRVNPGDTLHAPMRAFISAIANVSGGNMDEAERDFNGAMTNLQGQFAGGALLGQMMLRLVTGKRTGRQLEEDAPEFYSLVADKAGVLAADAANVAYAGGFPAQLKGIARSNTRQNKQGDEFEWNLIEALVAVRAPVREVSLGESLKFEAVDYRNANKVPSDNLKRIILLPAEERAGEDRLRDEVVKLIEAQQKPYEEMMRSATALRAAGQRQGMSAKDTETMIRGALKDATMSGDEIDRVVAGSPFRPRPLSQQFAANDIKNRIKREGVRQEKVRLEALYNQRLETVRRLMDEEIAKFD